MQALERQLWIDCRNGVAAAREQLILQYMPLAKRLAAGLYARRRVEGVEFADYLQLAHLGLLEAVQRYECDSDAQFQTFASYRIRGAILNGIPKMTETGERISYLRRAQRDRAGSVIEGTSPADSLATLLEVVIAVALTVQLDEIAERHAAEPAVGHDPYASRAHEEMQRRLRHSLDLLPERERQIVYFHYFHQVGFEELAGLMGITKGRVSQLHKRALDLIRETLGKTRLVEFY